MLTGCGLGPLSSAADVPSHMRRTYWYEHSAAPILGGISFYPPKAEERPTYLSMRESRMLVAMVLGWASFSLKTLSTTDSSVLVVSRPQKAHQSFTTIPAAITSLPRFTVPACQGMAQCVSCPQKPKSCHSPLRTFPKSRSPPCKPNCQLGWVVTPILYVGQRSCLSGRQRSEKGTLTTRGT